jgi:site-specific DNA-cytosine methylase
VPRHRIAQASHNHSGKRLLLAVRSSLKIDAATIPDADLLIGGFPCQGFSVANMNRRTGDKRNLLYQQFLLTAQCQLQLQLQLQLRVAKCSTLLD